MGFSGIFRSLVDISGNLMLVEFSKIPRLVESSKFLRRGVHISGIFRLVELSGFLRYRVNSYRNFRLVDLSKFFRF